jgi:uncharacterized protein YjiS (DUF1127 family)
MLQKSKAEYGRHWSMTLLSHNSGRSVTSHVWKRAGFIYGWFYSQLNEGVAAFLAHREYQATLGMLHTLSDRELRDMGLHRGQIGPALEEAANYRASRQKPNS